MELEKRKYSRTPIQLNVLLTLNKTTSITVQTWDISDGGMGIQIPNHAEVIWTLGMPAIAQVQGLPEAGPKIAMKVVRITDDRIGLKFASK